MKSLDFKSKLAADSSLFAVDTFDLGQFYVRHTSPPVSVIPKAD